MVYSNQLKLKIFRKVPEKFTEKNFQKKISHKFPENFRFEAVVTSCYYLFTMVLMYRDRLEAVSLKFTNPNKVICVTQLQSILSHTLFLCSLPLCSSPNGFFAIIFNLVPIDVVCVWNSWSSCGKSDRPAPMPICLIKAIHNLWIKTTVLLPTFSNGIQIEIVGLGSGISNDIDFTFKRNLLH